MSKITKLKSAKKAVEKVIQSNPLYVYVPSGLAAPGPPLGPQLGARGINIAQFCKEFNDKTKNMRPGVPIPCWITINADRSYNLLMHEPPISYFIRQAAGCQRGAMDFQKEIAGYMTVKHVYEIAKVKSRDLRYDCVPLEKICQEIIDLARRMGVRVVHKLDPKEYSEFLEERKKIVAQQMAELEEKRQEKMLRT